MRLFRVFISLVKQVFPNLGDKSKEYHTISSTYALSILGTAIGIIIILCVYFKTHAFIALTTASSFLAIMANMPLSNITTAIEKGMGNTLSFLALIPDLSTVIGKIIGISEAAERLEKALINVPGNTIISMTTTVGFMRLVIAAYPEIDSALITLAIGDGVNDAFHITGPGFWFVKESFKYLLIPCIKLIL